MALDTPRTNEVWDTADYDSHRRGLMEQMERELNEANLALAKVSKWAKNLTDKLKEQNAEHSRKYHSERRATTTPNAS